MVRLSAIRVALLALAIAAVHAPIATAGQQTVEPADAEARSFATSNGGWSSSVDYGGLACTPGVTCPPATPSYRPSGGTGGAADGHLRDTFGTLLGVLATTTISWSSPSFVAPAAVDAASLSVALRPQIASLNAIGTVVYRPRLIDVADGTRSVVIADVPLTAASASFSTRTTPLAAGSVVPGRTYRLQLDIAFTNSVSAVTSGNVDLDDVALTLSSLAAPSSLTASVPATGALRVTGAVDPQGVDTDVVVDYGATTAYGTTTTAVTIPGSATGTQPFTVPLSGLTAGATYHYRVRATNADGTVETTDATFVAPTPPSDAAPSVAGAANSRTRTVTFARAADVAAATVEAVDGGSAVVASAADGDGDGEVALTLPDADGSYGVRVVRESDRELRATSAAVPVTLDRVAPSTATLGLSVTPASALDAVRTVSFTRPDDADTVTAQVVDAADMPVGSAVTVTGDRADVTIGPAAGDYRVRLRLTDAAGNAAEATSTTVTLETPPAPVDPRTPEQPSPPQQPGAPAQPGTPVQPGAPAPPTTPVAPPACTPAGVITDVSLRAGRIHLTGWTAQPRGTAITIADDAGTPVVRATAVSGGRFTAVVRPSRGAQAGAAAGYRVVGGADRSAPVKLRRANALTKLVRAGTTATLHGRVDLARTGAVERIEAFGRADACAGALQPLETIGTARVDRTTGAYSLRIAVPAGDGPLVVRTRVTGARLASRSAFAVR